MRAKRTTSCSWFKVVFLSFLLAAASNGCRDLPPKATNGVSNVHDRADVALTEKNDEEWLYDDVLDVLDEEAQEGAHSVPAPGVAARAEAPRPKKTQPRPRQRVSAASDCFAGNSLAMPAPAEEGAGPGPKPEATLWLDELKYVHRTDVANHPGGFVGLMVSHDGRTVLNRNTNCQKRYRHHVWAPGTYEFYLKAFNPQTGKPERISNIVSYTILASDNPSAWLSVPVEDFVDFPPRPELTASVEIDENNSVTRSRVGSPDLKSLGWIVRYNGHVVLHRGAEGEFEYRYFKNEPGRYSVFLAAWTDSTLCYQRISNIVSYVVP